jgi:hypothetical protein
LLKICERKFLVSSPNYDKLYQQALSDPELRRTKVELEAALSNSRKARQVVFDLFQDLDGFSIDDYKPFTDVSEGMDRLLRFLSAGVAERGDKIVNKDNARFDLVSADGSVKGHFTRNREDAASDERLELLGLDHPVLEDALRKAKNLSPDGLGIAVDARFAHLVRPALSKFFRPLRLEWSWQGPKLPIRRLMCRKRFYRGR